MRFLSENSALNQRLSVGPVRRAVSVAAGLFLGIALSLHSFHSRPSAGSPSSASSVGSVTPIPAKPATVQRGWHQIGLASWYGPQFQGKETANGETFNMHDLTCAHRSLPLGTWVKVTNLHTRRWIVVRVNDRGPVPDTRIADLSSEAATMLGIHARGVARVRLDVIDPQKAVEVARLDKLRMARLAEQTSQNADGD
jgi:rare lipoprotein A